MRKILILLVSLFVLAIPVAANAAPGTPAIGNDSFWHIYTEFGLQMCVGTGSGGQNAGQPVIQHLNHSSCTRMKDIFQTDDPNGEPEYLWQFNSGNFMAATDDCQHVTIKSNSGSNGTVWILHPDINGHIFLVPRFCNQSGHYDNTLSSDNVDGHQWSVSSGGYQRLILDLQ